MIQARWQKMWIYNKWAWEHIFNSVAALSEEEFMAPRPFFWGSLHGLLAHCLAAEHIWIARLEGENPRRLYDKSDYHSLDVILSEWQPITARWQNYLDKMDDEKLAGQINYFSTEGEARSNNINDIVQHVFNHATEHRSQMTPILANLDQPTPALDFVFFSIEQQQKESLA